MKRKWSQSKRGRRNRINGRNFELKVRKDLEARGWIVSKWSNNVEFYGELQSENNIWGAKSVLLGRIIPAKHKFNPFLKALSMGTGFPDFIAYRKVNCNEEPNFKGFEVIGVESKTGKYLSKEEKLKVKWYIDSGTFNDFLVAYKDKKEKIIYQNQKLKGGKE